MEILLIIVFIVIFFVIITLKAKKQINKLQVWPYYVKKVLTNPEQILYHRLVNALPDYIILAQIQVSCVLGVKKGANFMECNNRINRLSYDFLICSKDSNPIIAIELDDKSHSTQNRIATDEKKDKATKDAGLKIIRWNVKSLPDEDIIKNIVL